MELFTSHPRARRRIALPTVLVLVLTTWYTFGAAFASEAATGSLSGVVFQDTDQDGIVDAGEPRWAEKGIWVLSSDGSTFVASGVTDRQGRYSITGLASGTYVVRYHPTSWRQVQDAWVPTTTADVWPEATVDVDSAATFDLGWRRAVTSSDWSSPVSAFDAPSGLRVESFTDAVTARRLHETLASGSLLGAEQAVTVLRFGYPGANSSCKHSVAGSTGTYSNFSAQCHIDYEDWLQSRHSDLFHEYGHAWSRYHQKVVHQWGDLDEYLVARGVDPSDSRLGSSHKWLPGEMIAEDFRILFGTDNASSYQQENTEIPHASRVPGLETWLRETFAGSVDQDPTEPSPTDSTAPKLSDLTPRDGSTIAGRVVASVHAQDDTASPDGMQVVLTFGDVQHVASLAPDGSWTASIDSTALADGAHALAATATDTAGNSAELRQTLHVDNQPEPAEEPEPTTDPDETSDDAPAGLVMDVATSTTSSGGSWVGHADVRVTNDGLAGSGLRVFATWTGEGRHGGSGSVSCTTDGAGRCRLSVEQAKRVSAVTFSISQPEQAVVTLLKP